MAHWKMYGWGEKIKWRCKIEFVVKYEDKKSLSLLTSAYKMATVQKMAIVQIKRHFHVLFKFKLSFEMW